jgi:PAS domain-containing protein
MTRPPEPADPSDWRRRAEELLAGEAGDRSRTETERLLHELRVHQLELEMQNDALNEARLVAEAGWERFRELYEGSPAGHFSVDGQGAILELNPAGAHLLGGDPALLLNRYFGQFLDGRDRARFAEFLRRGLEGGATPPCEVTLPKGPVRLQSAASADGRVLQMVAMDISGLEP